MVLGSEEQREGRPRLMSVGVCLREGGGTRKRQVKMVLREFQSKADHLHLKK